MEYKDKLESQRKAYEYIGRYTVNFQSIIFELQNLINWAFRLLGLEPFKITENENGVEKVKRSCYDDKYLLFRTLRHGYS